MTICKFCHEHLAEPDGYCHECGARLFEDWKADQDAEEGCANMHGTECQCAECVKLREYKPAGHSHGLPF